MTPKRIYIICAVRDATPEQKARVDTHVAALKAVGHSVHYPHEDVDQSLPGEAIAQVHLAAMKLCDEVHVFWNVTSGGSHWDGGMAYALGKPVGYIELAHPDAPGKSYAKVLAGMKGGDYAPEPEAIAFTAPSKFT